MALDAFPRLKEINESNFLRPNPSSLINNVPHQSLKDALNQLAQLRKSLRVIDRMDRIGEVGYWQQYMEALKWLNGEISLGQWISVPQIDDYQSADESAANGFNNFVSYLRNELIRQPLFSQVQMYVAAVEDKLVEDIVQENIHPLQSEFERELADSRSSLISSLEELQQQKEAALQGTFSTQVQDIRIEKDNAISEFTSARQLANWSDFYAERVRTYEKMLYGRVWPESAISRKWHAYRDYRSQLQKPKFWYYRASSIMAFLPGAWRCFSRAVKILNTKLRSYAGRRAFWFLAIILGAFIILAVNIASVYSITSVFGIDFTKLRPDHNDTQFFAKITVYVIFLAIPALGYSFANKNYRIYSNIIEQYRHREVVAKTIQGILVTPSDGGDADVRKELANVAATALFEQKTIGHLSKNEANSVSILDFVKIFRSS